jgi:hypothetical protein
MDLTTMIKTASVVMTFLLVMSLNVDDGMLARTGFDPVFIFALGVGYLSARRSAAVIACLIYLGLGANMPADFPLNLSVDRDYFSGLPLATR